MVPLFDLTSSTKVQIGEQFEAMISRDFWTGQVGAKKGICWVLPRKIGFVITLWWFGT